jgi:hypothetical protein
MDIKRHGHKERWTKKGIDIMTERDRKRDRKTDKNKPVDSHTKYS